MASRILSSFSSITLNVLDGLVNPVICFYLFFFMDKEDFIKRSIVPSATKGAIFQDYVLDLAISKSYRKVRLRKTGHTACREFSCREAVHPRIQQCQLSHLFGF